MTDTDTVTEQDGPGQARVFWGVLFERTLSGHAVDSLLDIAFVNATRRFERISIPYMRTDMARNRMARSFMEVSRQPEDVLVMLDGDHIHPHDIVVRLVNHPVEMGVVGALYFRRGEPYDPLFFQRIDGRLRNPAEWEAGAIYECAAVATGAIAIRRWVFEKLIEDGKDYPWFQYTYPPEADFSMTEDIFFAELCEGAGIAHYCDTSIITPHLGIRVIDHRDWASYMEAHPEILVQQGVDKS